MLIRSPFTTHCSQLTAHFPNRSQSAVSRFTLTL